MIAFSLDGNEIVYGLENGEVYEFSYKTRRCTLLITLQAAIIYLNVFEDYNNLNNGNCDGILVAAAVNGNYIVWKNYEILLCSLLPQSNNTLKIKFCIFLRELRSFLVIKEKRAMALWNLNDRSEHLLVSGKPHSKINYCALSPNERYFICILDHGIFEIYRVVSNEQINIQLEQEKQLADEDLKCCCFSYDEEYVAFGMENGDIKVISFCYFQISILIEMF